MVLECTGDTCGCGCARSGDDNDLVKRLADSPVCLEVCPSSNMMLSVVPSLAEHPLDALLDAGVHCSLNADDPLLFGPNVFEEYELCRATFGFGDERLALIARCSIDARCAPAGLKSKPRADIESWLGAP
jgi:adenosine deaminase